MIHTGDLQIDRAVAASSDASDIQSDEGGSQPTPPLQLSGEYGLIQSGQLALFSEPRVIGSFRGPLVVQEIRPDLANNLIKRHHYSHSVYIMCSRIHLGVFWHKRLVGVLQYGYAMNPHSQGSVVQGTAVDEYLELNRMWISDEMPRNTETAALSQSFRYIKTAYPKIAWIQSFADERSGRLGVVYQAASFIYCGEHKAKFYELDGEIGHRLIATAPGNRGVKGERFRGNLDRATLHVFRQFRYIKFLKRGWQDRLLLPALPYPKQQEPAA